jgi:uncharacterized membrane protein
MNSAPQRKTAFPIAWVLVFAVLAAYLLSSLKAAWIGAVIGYLVGRLRELEQQVAELQAQGEAAARPAPPVVRSSPSPTPPTTATKTAPVTAMPTVAASVIVSAPAVADRPYAEPIASTRALGAGKAPEAAAPPPWANTQPNRKPNLGPWASPAVPESVSWAQFEVWLKRGNPLARLGVIVTFFGAVFLIKYAAQEGYLPIAWRLGALAIGALAMVGTGLRLRHTASVYALTLQGGGLAVLYLVVLAAHRLYQLLPNGWALPLLIAVAAASALLSVRQNALALAVIGFSGGFAAPLLIGGGGSHIALFTYYTVLNLGVFAIAAYRRWTVLNLLGFVFTFIITALWRYIVYTPELFASTEFFLLLFFALYVAVTVLSADDDSDDRDHVVSGTLTFGLPAVVLSLQATIIRDYEYGLAWSAFGFGLFYLLLAALLRGINGARWALLVQAFIAIGVVALSIAVPLRYDPHATAAVWALEGAGAVWLGMRQDSRRARFFGVLIQFLAGISLMQGVRDHADGAAWLANPVPGAALLAIAGAISGLWFYRGRERLEDYESAAAPAALVWATGWAVYAGWAQIDHLQLAAPIGAELIYGSALAGVLHLFGQRAAWAWPRQLSLAVLLLFAWFSAPSAIRLHPFAAGGVYGWPVLFAVGYGLLWRRDRDSAARIDAATLPLHLGAFFALCGLLTGEAHWQLRAGWAGDWPLLAPLVLPALWLFAAARGLPRWPVGAHPSIYQRCGGTLLAIGLLALIVILSLVDAGNAAPLATLALLNPLDLAILAAFGVITLWWRGLDDDSQQSLSPERRWTLPLMLAGIVFLWLNSALLRGLHYAIGTPLSLDGIRHSALLQAAFSIFWGVLGFAAMLLAARRSWRPAWLAGAALMVVVALKLFLIDTAGTGTLSRIAAFLTVGVLMLITGYLAPLPPPRTDDDDAPPISA